eukprot:6193892-Pleurochrysis_carterae.AAC.2
MAGAARESRPGLHLGGLQDRGLAEYSRAGSDQEVHTPHFSCDEGFACNPLLLLTAAMLLVAAAAFATHVFAATSTEAARALLASIAAGMIAQLSAAALRCGTRSSEKTRASIGRQGNQCRRRARHWANRLKCLPWSFQVLFIAAASGATAQRHATVLDKTSHIARRASDSATDRAVAGMDVGAVVHVGAVDANADADTAGSAAAAVGGGGSSSGHGDNGGHGHGTAPSGATDHAASGHDVKDDAFQGRRLGKHSERKSLQLLKKESSATEVQTSSLS